MLYSHGLPGGRWLPGSASNVGGDWIRQDFADVVAADLDREAAPLLPVDVVSYPLRTRGERILVPVQREPHQVSPGATTTDGAVARGA